MATFYEIKTADAAAPQVDGLPPGVTRTAALFFGVLTAIAIPYAVIAATGEPPDEDAETLLGRVADLRAWMPGDAVPFSTLFTTTDAGVAIAEAGMTRLSAAGVPAEAAGPLAALAADPGGDAEGPDLAAPFVLVRPPETRPPAPTHEPPDAGPTDASPTAIAADAGATSVDAGPAAEDSAPARPTDPLAGVVVPPEAWEGITAEIEDPSGAMAHFYASLGRTALAEPGAVTRITQWGDSAIAADGMTAAARRLLQRQFGDAGHGFGLVASGNPWYRQKDVDWTSSGWKTWEFIRKQASDGRYGYGGVAAVGYLGAAATWATVEGATGDKASRFEVWYAADKGGGKLEVSVDGEALATLDTEAGAPSDEVYAVDVPDGQHTFKIRNVGGGATRVFGVVLERSVPGVVYDAIGIVGARAARQLFADEQHFVGQIAKRRPDLMILMYGGNALPDKTSMDVYEEAFGQVVERFRRGRPEASCLVMSPLDHGERHRGRVRSVPRIHELMAAQRKVALAKGCAWYSIFDAMGGEGSVGTWYDSGLTASDLAHPTARGSKVLGALWYKSLMKGFAGWLETRKVTP
ncbi:MAG: hypothetical protein CVU56_22400 [Deltaproteobacteria bacterium HGW-Deltaproteobacteria-14]|nr:MAG: hypothetical protein CVU56_22400 [Deltaproteobacteria bacterium HGW-Deltaproteobacteria-14]